MTNNRNLLLKKAFEEAAKKEIENMSDENQIIVPFSERHNEKMQKIFESEKLVKRTKDKHYLFRRIAVFAAVLMTLVITASITAGASFWELFDPKNFDSKNYTRTEWVIDDSYTTGAGADEFVEVAYNGRPITIKYSLDTGINSSLPERALMVLVNGVRQTFDATVGDKKYENIDILPLERGLGTKQYAELTFRPDMGKKGEVLALEVASVFDSDNNFYSECAESDGVVVAHYDDDKDNSCDRCGVNIGEVPVGPPSLTVSNEAFAKIVMKKNAPRADSRVCENFSGYAESVLHEKIYACFNYDDGTGIRNDYDKLESLCAKIYQNIDESLVYEQYGRLVYKTALKTTAKTDDKVTINLHGKSGKYRVAFYIGTEPQPVFDGKDYIDVEIKDGKQVELNIGLDTTKLPGENKFSVVYKHIGDNLFEDYWWHTLQICEGTIIVE